MLCTLWAAKGGVGVTVVTALAAVSQSRDADFDVVAVDLAGDLAASLGVAEPPTPGLLGWLAGAGDDDALDRLAVDVAPRLTVLPRGTRAPDGIGFDEGRADALVARLAGDHRIVLVDAGTLPMAANHHPLGPLALSLAARASRSLLVTRCCYLALRRAMVLPVPPSGVVVVVEPGRALDTRIVAEHLGVPVAAELAIDQRIARAVDAGILASRPPAGLHRRLRGVAA